MKLVTFNPFRTVGIPGVMYIKPEKLFKEKQIIQNADYVLFPEYWQVNLLVYGLHKKIFPNINTYHLGHNKIEMTRVLSATFPQNIPFTVILNKEQVDIDLIEEQFGYPVVCKEIKNSMGKGVFLIQNRKQLKEYINNNEILYIQEVLPIDRDLRVVYVGDKVITGYWRIGREGVFHNNIAKGGSYSFDNVPQEALRLVEDIAKTLGINHAGFDIAVVDGKCYVLEFNVLFGNEALRHLNIKIEPLIYHYIASQFNPNNPTLGTKAS